MIQCVGLAALDWEIPVDFGGGAWKGQGLWWGSSLSKVQCHGVHLSKRPIFSSCSDLCCLKIISNPKRSPATIWKLAILSSACLFPSCCPGCLSGGGFHLEAQFLVKAALSRLPLWWLNRLHSLKAPRHHVNTIIIPHNTLFSTSKSGAILPPHTPHVVCLIFFLLNCKLLGARTGPLFYKSWVHIRRIAYDIWKRRRKAVAANIPFSNGIITIAEWSFSA